MKKLFPLLILLAWSVTGFGTEEVAPEEDSIAGAYPKAVAEAKSRNVPIYLLFSNLHSCPPCKRLNETVLQTEEFKTFAKDNLVVVEVDFGEYYADRTRRGHFMEKVRKAGVPERFKFKAWPYLFLLSPDEEIIYEGRERGVTSLAAYMSNLKSRINGTINTATP